VTYDDFRFLINFFVQGYFTLFLNTLFFQQTSNAQPLVVLLTVNLNTPLLPKTC